MPPRPRKIPSYCRHKASGQAVVCIDGKDYYLGKYGTPESHAKYQRLIAESFAPGRLSDDSRSTASETLRLTGQRTIVELVAAYWTFAKSYYVKNGEASSEQVSINLALRPLIELYGRSDLREFGPLSLEPDCPGFGTHGSTLPELL